MLNIQNLQNTGALSKSVSPSQLVRLSSAITGLSGLAAYYPMDEPSGNAINRAPDTLGTLGGTVTGATLNQTGLVGKAYSFDGAGDKVVVTDANTLDFSTGMTMMALIRMVSANPYPSIATKYSANTGYEAYFDRDLTKFAFKVGVGASASTVLSTLTYSFATWYFFVATYDKVKLRLYINGATENTADQTSNIAANTTDLGIGGIGTDFGDGNATGLMQHLALFNRALNTTEIATLDSIIGL